MLGDLRSIGFELREGWGTRYSKHLALAVGRQPRGQVRVAPLVPPPFTRDEFRPPKLPEDDGEALEPHAFFLRDQVAKGSFDVTTEEGRLHASDEPLQPKKS